MSQLTELDTLFDIEKNLEAGFSAYLTANGITAFSSRTTDNLPDSRVVCLCQQGPATGHKAPPPTSKTGWHEEDFFEVVLHFQIQTERSVDTVATGTRMTHDQMVARVRTLMLRGAINGTLAGVTALDLAARYSFPFITMSAYDTEVDAEQGLDTTTISFSAQLQITAAAWPSP